MPLSPPAPRTAQHQRRVNYQGFERADGLWDIEGELHDSKMRDTPLLRTGGVRRAGEAIHHMRLRVTISPDLVVQAIEASMDTHPLAGCAEAQAALQTMVGCSMARGWRQAIQNNLGGVASCTHLRELLFNLATAAFQTMSHVFATPGNGEPPRHLGQCTGWDFQGEGVREYYPQFYRHGTAASATLMQQAQTATTAAETGQEPQA